jgi:exopolysaccharide biosynthesis polyprenyl glycosylphosphotransferase
MSKRAQAALSSGPEFEDQASPTGPTMLPRLVAPGPQEQGDEASQPPLRRLLIAVDLMVIAIGWAAAVAVSQSVASVALEPAMLVTQTLFMLGAGGLVLSASGLYRRRICAIRSAEIARIGRASLGLAVTAAVLLAGAGREAAVVAGLVGVGVWFTVLVAERGIFREWIQVRRATGDFGAPVVVVAGTHAAGRGLTRFLTENAVLGFDVLGLISPTPLDPSSSSGSPPWLGSLDRLDDSVAALLPTGLVLDAHSLADEELSTAMHAASLQGLHAHISIGMRGVDRRRISVAPLADETFLHVVPLSLTRSQVVAKRLLDVTLGSFALLLLAPVLLVSGLAIWFHDRGPVFYRQQRVGKDGERFTLYKLRTMVLDAEQQRTELDDHNGRSGPLFKLPRDPRVTPVGRFLRASSLDEAPQLLNVLEGTMSLVGPRPALPEEVAQFDEELAHRLSVKPGMTGLWQVEARDLASFDLYRRFDLLYVENWSPALDVTLIARTIVVVPLRTLRSVMPSRWRRRAVVELE